jgi:hypothetical protein
MLFLDVVTQRLQIVAVFALPHRHGWNIVRVGSVVDPAQRGHRGLDDPQDRNPSTDAASFRIAQFCHVVSIRPCQLIDKNV